MIADNDNNGKTFILEGTKNFIVKLEDNTGKEPETAERTPRKRNFHYNIPNKIDYSKNRYIHPFRGQYNSFYNNRRRYRGLWPKRRGFKIIIRNLAKEVTNYDIKSIFERIGPISRCGIIWNNGYGNKNIAEVEYVYISDALKAYRKLDYKSIKGIPIRIGIKDIMSQNLFFGRSSPYVDYRNIFSINYIKRIERDARRRNHHYSKNFGKISMRHWKRRRV